MDIYLFNYVGDDRVVHKSINIASANISMVNGTLRDASEFITPSFTMVTDPTGMNYCYIPAFERYYYITSITVVRTGLWAIECRVDVLKTYEDYIDELLVWALRTSKNPSEDGLPGYNALIKDEAEQFIQPTFELHMPLVSATGVSPMSYGDYDEYILVTVG